MTPSDQPAPVSSELRYALAWQSTGILVTVLSVAAFWIPIEARAQAGALHVAFAVGVCCALALRAWMLSAVTPMAAMTGALLSLSLCISRPTGADWWRSPLIPLLALFALTHFATRFCRERKEKVGLAEARRGRRASQVAANIGAATLVLPAMAVHPWLPSTLPCLFCEAAALPAIVAALAEAAADTVSSEMGQALSGQPRMITTGRRVRPGTDGAVSLAGTLAGAIAAAIVVLVAMTGLALTPRAAAIAYSGAIFGLFFDSLLGATVERRGWLNNDAVNFLSTLAAAVMAGVLAFAWGPVR